MARKPNSLFGVVLAGGGGARLWPVSREHFPKQFLSVGGKWSLFQRTLMRLLPAVSAGQCLVVTNRQIDLEIKSQILALRSLFPGVSRHRDRTPIRILKEPRGRNTAAAVGIAALLVRRLDPDGIMAVLPADHLILKEARFLRLLAFSQQVARENKMVTFGITPDRPETGYGYIQIGPATVRRAGCAAHAARRFVEKPDLKRARHYLARGGYVWNSGIFVWKAAVILDEIRRWMPPLHSALREIDRAIGTDQEEEVVRRVYDRIESISIDYGVLERSDRVAVVPADIGWSDVGDWAAVYRLSPRDRHGNVREGPAIMIDNENAMVISKKRFVAAVGLKDLMVIDTPDALLVCRKDRTQDVKKIVGQLKSSGSTLHLMPTLVRRPWGTYEVLQIAPTFQVKRLVVSPGASISLQYHQRRSEHWVVVSGRARVTRGKKGFILRKNESTFIPPKMAHALANGSAEPLEVIEVQSGRYLGEDDIVRFHDRYGRCDPDPPISAKFGGLP